MTDEILITRFLDKNFDIDDAEYGKLFDKHTSSSINDIGFRKLFLTIFDGYVIGDDLPIDIATKWYKNKIDIACADINTYLVDCKLILGPTDWIVLKSDNTIVTEETVINEFKEKHPQPFTKKYYYRWYSDMVIDESERIMNQY